MNVTEAGSPDRICLAIHEIAAAPEVWELDGPTITGPIMSNILM